MARMEWVHCVTAEGQRRERGLSNVEISELDKTVSVSCWGRSPDGHRLRRNEK